jgi:hypothetical protein
MASEITAGVVRRPIGLMLAATLLSWLGEYLHNLYELPALTLLSPENSTIAAISLALFAVWWLTPFGRAAALLLLAWGLLHLVGGGIISVIPFGFLPYYPEQTLDHYGAHVFYGLA